MAAHRANEIQQYFRRRIASGQLVGNRHALRHGEFSRRKFAIVSPAEAAHQKVVRRSFSAVAGCRYRGIDAIAAPFADELGDPPVRAEELVFDGDSLAEVRELVARWAEKAGLVGPRAENLVLAANEIATNSIRHGGGSGVLRMWTEDGVLLCQIEDRGRIEMPLAGRLQPVLDKPGGRGLWLANQLCDLVQVRTFEDGNVVRIHLAR